MTDLPSVLSETEMCVCVCVCVCVSVCVWCVCVCVWQYCALGNTLCTLNIECLLCWLCAGLTVYVQSTFFVVTLGEESM